MTLSARLSQASVQIESDWKLIHRGSSYDTSITRAVTSSVDLPARFFWCWWYDGFTAFCCIHSFAECCLHPYVRPQFNFDVLLVQSIKSINPIVYPIPFDSRDVTWNVAEPFVTKGSKRRLFVSVGNNMSDDGGIKSWDEVATMFNDLQQ